MTEWQLIDQRRKELTPRSKRRIRIELNRQTLAAIRFLKAYKTLDDYSLIATVREDRVRKVFDFLYIEVGLDFAKYSGRKVLGRKDLFDDLEGFFIRQAEGFIRSRLGKRITGITETTRRKILEIFKEAQKDGLSIPRTARKIRREMFAINRARAEIIARTEIVSASNFGSFMGARALGIELRKEWLATPDSRTRTTHLQADGQKRRMDDQFTVGGARLQYPGDPTGPLEETIQCRCAMAFKVA